MGDFIEGLKFGLSYGSKKSDEIMKRYLKKERINPLPETMDPYLCANDSFVRGSRFGAVLPYSVTLAAGATIWAHYIGLIR